MAKYINVDNLGIGKCNPNVFEDKGYAKGWNAAIDIIEKAPAADVRPVVLCRDCGHCIDGFICKNGHWNGMTFPGNFCSDGERKEGTDMREES